MGSLSRKIIRVNNHVVEPHHLLIEKTALELAATFYEAGRSSGLTSKHKDARKFAKANVEKFIPKAVELLTDMLGNPSLPADQKDMIYNAIMERTNDPELSNNGIKAFENNTEFTSDDVVLEKPIIVNTGASNGKKEI